MNLRTSLRELPENKLFQKGDVFVLFGELFDRGYANGLVEQARAAGLEIIGFTVGRRTESGELRPLTDEELATAEARLGGRIINVPLMAGFDQDAPAGGLKPQEIIGQLTLENWKDAKFDWDYLAECRKIGVDRFRSSAKEAFAKLADMVPEDKNIYFAHIMAGGVPKTKVFLALANRIYKGTGPRFLSSNDFIASDLGKLVLQNFEEVTANTFDCLIEGTAAIRERAEKNGKQVRYSAYGYHGTEILINDVYEWQTYSNYTQGYAKIKLEQIAEENWEKGIKATVYNCPEIRTNSSDIFVGVELPLFSLLLAMKKEGGGEWVDKAWNVCRGLLREDVSLEMLLEKTQTLNASEVFLKNRDFAAWPTPNAPDLAETVIGVSREITQLHQSNHALITDNLSALVVNAAGMLIFKDMSEPEGPVVWLNHDIVAKQLIESAPKVSL
ncbi:hypothetical protein [Rhizobium sp. L1K21]|uniref:enoyl ACP reductase FabMG family protein n=1 Tax=Rhizobium sp. L1K21 TaxID=2954933 RepID=UPI002092F688|nr:hypothetical protein [Rhizobium sp. L1K21]MCO6185700.1 hypothetical protein [Rhizobium sp. L1K21]